MAPRSLLPRLNDILRSIDIASQATDGKTLDDLNRDAVLRFAIERAIEIVSEAVRHILEDTRALFPEIPWRNIMTIGNKLRNEYDRIDPDIIWDIATTHLNALKPVIEAIRAQQGDQ